MAHFCVLCTRLGTWQKEGNLWKIPPGTNAIEFSVNEGEREYTGLGEQREPQATEHNRPETRSCSQVPLAPSASYLQEQ